MYYAGKPSRRFAESFAATVLDRDTGMLAMMLIAATATIDPPREAGWHTGCPSSSGAL